MKTHLILCIVIPDDTIYGEARLSVSKWDDDKLVRNSTAYKSLAIVKPLEDDDNVYPWAVAALRDVVDDAIGSMLTKMSVSEVLLMHPPQEHKEELRVGAVGGLTAPAKMGPMPVLRGDGMGPCLLVEPRLGE